MKTNSLSRTILRLEPLEDRCVSSAGVLDPTFGSGGTVTTSFAKSRGTAESDVVAIQPDGKIIAAGSSEIPNSLKVGYFELARYNPDGSLDTTFGSKGEVTTQIGARSFANAVALQPDGKILVAGLSELKAGDAFLIVRYNSDGSLDRTFGQTGMVATIIAPSSEAWSLDLVTVNGVTKIVATGDVYSSSMRSWVFGLARYNLDGSVDTSFGSGGEVVTNIVTDNSYAQGSRVQGDGKIVVAGTFATVAGPSFRQFALARFNSDGSLDATFGTGGLVLTAIGQYALADAVALQSDGKIVAGGNGNSNADFALVRYSASGSLDASFGSGGVSLTSGSWFKGLVIQPADGKIIASGGELARYNPDGTLDATFGTGGIVTPTFGQGETAIALQSDGKIVTTVVNNGNFGVARYLASEPLIGSFTASSNSVASGSSVTLIALSITDGNYISTPTVTQVAFYYDDSSGTKHVLGYGIQTSPGVWALSFTVNLASGTYTLYAQAEDSYGVFGDPLSFSLTVQ